MRQFEYQVRGFRQETGPDAETLEQFINNYASQGWRAVSFLDLAFSTRVVFEREKGAPLDSFKGRPNLETRTKDV